VSEPIPDYAPKPSYSETLPRVGVAERSHESIRQQITEVLEGPLSPDEQRGLEAHLVACRPCAAFRRTLEATVGALRDLPPTKAPAASKRRVMGSLP
jgi:anti-sigma factor RsiW